MTRILPIAATALVLLALTPAAQAVDILNEDGRDYDVIVVENGAESSFTLFSGGAEDDVCAACTLEIEGLGSIDASGKDTIVISGGKLTKKTG